MTIRGFITNLGKYNEGYLVGEWVDFPIDEDELEEVLERIGINEEYEEYFFADWEIPDLNYVEFGEYENVDKINEIAEMLESLDESDLNKLNAIMDTETNALDEAINSMDEYIFYENMTLKEVACELVEECYFTKDTPDIFQRYFDYEAFARDLSFDGYTETAWGVIERC